MRINSIQASLTTFLAVQFLLIATVSVVSVAGLGSIDGKLNAVNRKWVAGTQVLEELGSRFSEFRIAEGYRALATNAAVARQADFLAKTAANKAGILFSKYEALIGNSDDADLRELKALWTAYVRQHDAWAAAAGPLSPGAGASYGSALQKAYDAVQVASRQLINEAKSSAAAEAAAGSRLASRITLVVTVLAVAASLLTAASIVRVVLRIARPLRSITTALVRLADGERDVRVPDAKRNDEIGDMVKAFHVFVANAAALAEAKRASEILSLHDALTGLPNRRRFAAELEAASEKAADRSSAFAVMLVDLDRFKPVNDLRGHAAGDSVLCEVAARLTRLLPEATVARLGGDEFAAIVELGAESESAAELAAQTARRMVAAIEAPIDLGDTHVTVSASIGVALHPADGRETDAILRAADLAMYRAKNDGRGTFRFFEQSMDAELRREAELASDLRNAVLAGEIRPHFQPLIDMSDNRISGFEVLARWHHPEKGHVAPDVFIPLVEKLGLLEQMTRSLLAQAVGIARDWDGGPALAVNVSPTQLQDATFPDMVAETLAREGFPASRLEIEVTETALANDLGAVKASIGRLQRLGVRVALDDFGIGVSNLHHLRELSFDKIKIDRSFVQSMRDSVESEKIVFAALDLARSLGMPAVAEGIENAETVRLLAEHGCAYGQGYFFSRAVPAEIANALLLAQRGGLKERHAQQPSAAAEPPAATAA